MGRNSIDNGKIQIYTQNERYLFKINDNRDPIEVLESALTVKIKKDEGNIIVMGNFYNNVQKGKLKNIMKILKMKEIILDEHSNNPLAT